MTVAAAIAIAAALGAFWATRPAPPTATPDVPVMVQTPDSPPSVWVPLIENPLTNEVQNLADEAESGVLFLMACLDVSPLADSSAPPMK